jgi:hypothetical protein
LIDCRRAPYADSGAAAAECAAWSFNAPGAVSVHAWVEAAAAHAV